MLLTLLLFGDSIVIGQLSSQEQEVLGCSVPVVLPSVCVRRKADMLFVFMRMPDDVI